ncbi:PQQ-dependent sugar dehydrogenase [Pedobacter sp. HMF7056]|uniref:PQQ-dependent sugar dehydrogenase n=2 Tax=Hufsiella ginkgonis TaxID=2695274 RepID=A0A7K1XZ91_9SPHI|nr:PQQ-dependent sugar dehydrogenase [Hufsiella ginkgonis]
MIWVGACKKSGEPATEDLADVELSAKVLNQSLTFPWEVLWGPDNMLWLTERGGRISKADPGTGALTPLLNIGEVKSEGEGGLLGMVLHPDFSTTPEVFVAYNYDKNGVYTEKIVKYTYNGTTLINPVVLLDNIAASTIHNGCRLAISPDKKLFITSGDASVSPNAQNLSNISGKILRINLNGSIPADNPNPASPVWSYGHRNAQGLVFVKDRLYSSEHGNTTDDEINIITKGKNFGWPNVEGFCNTTAEQSFCSSNGVQEPVFAWTPTIAPSGIDYYNHTRIPQWRNSLLLAVLKGNVLIQLKLDDAGNTVTSATEFFKTTYGRLRDVCVSPEGRVYLITSDGSKDKLVVIDKKE